MAAARVARPKPTMRLARAMALSCLPLADREAFDSEELGGWWPVEIHRGSALRSRRRASSFLYNMQVGAGLVEDAYDAPGLIIMKQAPVGDEYVTSWGACHREQMQTTLCTCVSLAKIQGTGGRERMRRWASEQTIAGVEARSFGFGRGCWGGRLGGDRNQGYQGGEQRSTTATTITTTITTAPVMRTVSRMRRPQPCPPSTVARSSQPVIMAGRRGETRQTNINGREAMRQQRSGQAGRAVGRTRKM